jgi:hypothetical protein
MNPIAASSDRLAHITAGNATVTLESGATGARFTYRVSAPMTETDNGGKRRDHEADIRFVSLLTGPNVYAYIGFLSRRDGSWAFVHGRQKANAGTEAKSVKAIAWLMRHPESAAVAIYHSGSCGRCGRELTVPESVKSGLGPVCRGAA